jgi:hypothetical protein
MRESQLQATARRCGLKIVLHRYSAAAPGQKRYFLRPIWDAKRAVRLLSGGEHELVALTVGRRRAASLLTLDGVEHVLAPARLPWQAS